MLQLHGSFKDIEEVFYLNVNAAAVGSMLVYQKKGMGVLVNVNNLKR
jgi:hypothetical protein